MYNVYNASNVYFLWDIEKQQKSLIGDENDLIHFIAKCYKYDYNYGYYLHNPLLNSYACNANETDKRYQIFDGMDRCINPRIYEREARLLYLNHYKKLVNYYQYSWRKNNKNTGRFRYDPVPHTRNYRIGGPTVKHRRVKHLKQMYANPEYKEFNRGSHKDVPDGWWDDWYRHVERNWKRQRKTQWKTKKE